MLDLQQILADIARAIVDDPDAVTVSMTETANTILLELSVAPDDMGMVIGRHGRIAKAIRTVMKAASGSCGKKVAVEIK